mmetsp:Transcript_20749/g.29827  ORF Transcript_20749/g.29827 Transcript_20749/m.29827 type:complete len:1346 (+) Transcript_20749:114-4151(+)
MSALESQSWQDRDVWYCTSSQPAVWESGVVAAMEYIDNGTWAFVIISGDSMLNISTSYLDKSNEFAHVKRRAPQTTHVQDLTLLPYLNEPEIIECVRQRYLTKCMYTNIGTILLALNPFEKLPIYSHDNLNSYFREGEFPKMKLGPHIYQLSDRAYQKMFIDKYNPDKRENQTILINGESGSGKTESTKLILHYLATVSSKVATDVLNCSGTMDFESLINAVNPITESFGNARTSRNNNSSRFGKFIELNYTADGFIEGVTIHTYLLETVRVVSQSKGERNYHVFYECFSGLSPTHLLELGMRAPEDFYYTNRSGEYFRHDDVSDGDNFKRLQEALSQIHVRNDEQDSMFRVLAAVLHIGNLSFEESTTTNEEAAVLSKDCKRHVDYICALLEIDETVLTAAVSTRNLLVAGTTIRKVLNIDKAVAARDSFAKTLYDLLFKWIIFAVNQSLYSDCASEVASFIGVLDIFGFEFFETNSFEQLCINYANEKLQDHFNYSVFKSEQEIYEDEGLIWNFHDYPSNSDRLKLFEHKVMGVFSIFDEQLKLPKPTDDKVANVLYSRCSSSCYFHATHHNKNNLQFTVHHYADSVQYSLRGVLNKNRSDVAPEIVDVLQQSRSVFVNSIGRIHTPMVRHHGASRSIKSVGPKMSTVSSDFCKQLQQLVSKIRTTRSHFIRCIKPNNALVPNVFDNGMVVSQLRCSGVMEAVTVFKSGFSNRIYFPVFVSRYSAFVTVCGINVWTREFYRSLEKGRRTEQEKYWRLAASKLIGVIRLSEYILNAIENVSNEDTPVNLMTGLQLGRSQIFLQESVFNHLEHLYERSVVLMARRLQRRWRAAMLSRNDYSRAKAPFAAVKALLYFSDFKRRRVVERIAAAMLLQRKARVYIAVMRLRRVKQGISKVKAAFRGYRARRMITLYRNLAATAIQACYRRHVSRRMYLLLFKSAATIRRYSVVWNAVRRRRRKILAVIRIQSCWRRKRAHVHAISLKESKIQAKMEQNERISKAKELFMLTLEARLVENPHWFEEIESFEDKIKQLRGRIHELKQQNADLHAENSKLVQNIDAMETESFAHPEVQRSRSDQSSDLDRSALHLDVCMYVSEIAASASALIETLSNMERCRVSSLTELSRVEAEIRLLKVSREQKMKEIQAAETRLVKALALYDRKQRKSKTDDVSRFTDSDSSKMTIDECTGLVDSLKRSLDENNSKLVRLKARKNMLLLKVESHDLVAQLAEAVGGLTEIQQSLSDTTSLDNIFGVAHSKRMLYHQLSSRNIGSDKQNPKKFQRFTSATLDEMKQDLVGRSDTSEAVRQLELTTAEDSLDKDPQTTAKKHRFSAHLSKWLFRRSKQGN